MSHSYPTLGFDPAPGETADVDTLVTSLNAARDSLGEASTLLHNLNSSSDSSWRGEAADKFRDHVTEEVPKALRKAHDSFEKASTALSTWSTELSEYQRQARELERQAVQAKHELDAAEAHAADVRAHPFHVVGQSTPDLEAEARTKQHAAESTADTGVGTARSALEDVRTRARTLEAHHHASAATAAGKLKDAPDKLAPEEPGMFHKIGSWLSDHAGEIGDILADISAVTGILALITPPPLDAVFLGVSVLSSLGAMGFHYADGQRGWTLVGDAVGAVPGIGVIGDAAKGARAVETVSDGVRMARTATSVGDRAFGARYVATAISDTVGKVPRAAMDTLAETKVLGSNTSRLMVNGLERIPGVTIHDGLTAAARIDKVAAGIPGAVGATDLALRTGGSEVPGPIGDTTGSAGTGYGGAGGALDLAERLHVMQTVQVR